MDICVQQSTINTTIPVCLLVCPCCPAVIYWAPSPPAGSAMSGLDSLIGAEERIINSKPKISDNVVSPSSSSSFCLCLEAFLFLPCSTRELRAALLKRLNTVYRYDPSSLNSLLQPQAHLIVLMIRNYKYIQCFHIAVLSSAFNESDVVIVTAISHWAICMSISLASANQPSFRSTPSHASFFFFAKHPTPRLGDFRSMLGC